MCQSCDGVYWTMLWILDHGIWRANQKFCMNSKWRRLLCDRYWTINASEGSNWFHKTSIKHVFNSIRSLFNVQCSIFNIFNYNLKIETTFGFGKKYSIKSLFLSFIVRFWQQPTALNNNNNDVHWMWTEFISIRNTDGRRYNNILLVVSRYEPRYWLHRIWTILK